MKPAVAFIPVLACALAGCSMAPRYARPEQPVPPSWPVGDAYLRQSEAGLPAVSFQEIFRDKRLQSLVDLALENKRDLRIAAANIAAARGQLKIQRAEQLPEVGAGASASRDSGAGSTVRTSLVANIGISGFELDLFGRLASATEAERQNVLATEAAARTVRLGLVSDIASAWSTYAADADLLAIAEQLATNARKSVSLTRARLQGGIAPRTDLRQAEQVLATAEGDVAAQKTALAQDRNLIDLLVGAPVESALLPQRLAEVVASINTLPAGTSADILLRRPDVLEAEYRLKSANADIGVARAALFPRISLTGLFGFASGSLGALFTSDSFYKSASGAASYPIFSGGAARAGVAVSQAKRDAALASYEKAIQTAFREVADALARQGTITDQLRAATNRVTAAADVATLAEARYRVGIDSYLENLDAQRSLYSAQQGQVAVQLGLIANRIALFRSLGGDQATAGDSAPSR